MTFKEREEAYKKRQIEEKAKIRQEPKKFKSSEFISPIFGKDSNRTNDEFLQDLKDFRSNL